MFETSYSVSTFAEEFQQETIIFSNNICQCHWPKRSSLRNLNQHCLLRLIIRKNFLERTLVDFVLLVYWHVFCCTILMNFCFPFTAQNFSDRVVGYLQQKLEQVSEKSKCATLAILKHLINSSGSRTLHYFYYFP